MSKARHSWIRVSQPKFLEGLLQLAAFPMPKRKGRRRTRKHKDMGDPQKFILALEGRDLSLSNGLTSVHVVAKGKWVTDAVLPYTLLDVVTNLVEELHGEKTLLLEGVGEHLRIGGAAFSCSFQNAEINVRGVMNAERELQRIKKENPKEAVFGSRHLRNEDLMAAQIRKLYPACINAPSLRHRILSIPDAPNLLICITKRYLDLRFLESPGADSEDCFERSTIWKRVGYETVETHGLTNILAHAVHVANAHGKHSTNPEN